MVAMTHRYELKVRRVLTPEAVGYKGRRQRGKPKYQYLDPAADDILLDGSPEEVFFITIEARQVGPARCGTSVANSRLNAGAEGQGWRWFGRRIARKPSRLGE